MLGNRYELLDRVGRGGMSVVWRARDRTRDRSVAVKVLVEPYAEDHAAQQRLRHEARIAAAVSSRFVVRAWDSGDYVRGAGVAPFIVMEFVRGISLQERLRAGPVPPAAAMRIGARVASALTAIHAAGVVHGDIKPANIMVADDDVKVVDFGIAAAERSASARGHPAQILGTPAYVAPERLVGDGVRASADVYALGVLLYRLLADCSPWVADTTTQMLAAHVSQQPAPLPPRAGIPATVTALCGRCLAKDPTRRPSAHEAEALLSIGVMAATGNGTRAATDLPVRSGSGAAPAGWRDRALRTTLLPTQPSIPSS